MKILITGGNGNIAKIIKNNLKNNNNNQNNTEHTFNSPGRDKLNLLDAHMVKDFMENNEFDICFHTCILGGRRTKAEDYDVVYINLLMFENLMKYSHKFKMIFNMDSGAIYDRNTDILNRKEEEMNTIPEDFYGFSKYIIHQRSLSHINLYNLRIFNIFHPNEEDSRFIKLCFSNSKNDTIMNIQDDKYFDFFYYLDFIKIIEYYLNNIDNQELLPKTINISYDKKYKLSEIARLVSPNIKLNISNENSKNNYSGNPEKINDFRLNFMGLENSINHYRESL